MIKVYIAGPYTKIDPCINTNIAINIANELWDRGFCPFIPHLSHFWHTVTPKPYEQWLAYDLYWIDVCDCLLRFPGESSGADKEIVYANKVGIPVFYSIEELEKFYA